MANFSSLPLPFVNTDATTPAGQSLPPFPPTLRVPTMELASSHLICSVALTGVLLLQAGRWWAEQKDIDDDEEEDEQPSAERTTVQDSKTSSVDSKKIS